jgi:hypothetical protein
MPQLPCVVAAIKEIGATAASQEAIWANTTDDASWFASGIARLGEATGTELVPPHLAKDDLCQGLEGSNMRGMHFPNNAVMRQEDFPYEERVPDRSR